MRKLMFACLVVLLACGAQAQDLRSGTQMRLSFADTIKNASPAVVNIFTRKVVKERRAQHPFMNDPFFSYFFNPRTGLSNGDTSVKERVEQSLGSGVIVSPSGVMVTNFHVIEGADEIVVVFANGQEANARFLNADKRVDIAVLQIEGEGQEFPYLPFMNSDTIEVGDVVLALGNPYGVGQSVTMGIVSAVGRSTAETGPYQNFIQTDAAINPGNSGGALVDSTGALIGVNTAIFTKSGGNQGIGFAVPANTVRSIVEQIVENGKVVRPWLGAIVQNVTPELAESLGLKTPKGVLVSEVAKSSPAEKASMRVGDIIVKIDGAEVEDVNAMSGRLYATRVGQTAQFLVLREGHEQVLFVPMEGLPERRPEDQITLQGRHPLNNVTVEQLSPALNVAMGFDVDRQGVAVTENKGSGMFAADLRPGDVLVQINQSDIRSISDIEPALKKSARRWHLVFERKGQAYQVVIQR